MSSVSVGGKDTYTASTQKTERLISKATAEILREYMGNNVESKYGADRFPVTSVCGKSGTAEVGGGKAPNALFTGFINDYSIKTDGLFSQNLIHSHSYTGTHHYIF